MAKKGRRLTREDVAWLRHNWNPTGLSFRDWVAGSDHAHKLVALLINDAEERLKKEG